MIVRHRRIGKTVENSKLIHIVPNSFIIRMEDMGAIYMDMDALYLFRIYIPPNVTALIHHKDFLPCPYRFTGKYRAE